MGAVPIATSAVDRTVSSRRRWSALIELVIASVVVIGDWIVPTLVLLAMAAVSLAIGRERPESLGFTRGYIPFGSMSSRVVGIIVGWTVVQIGLIMPLLNRVFNTTQDLTQFENLQSNEAELALFLALTWTLAAVGEELVYRGLVFTRASEAIVGRQRIAGAVIVSAVLFGLAHTEQGAVGVVATTLDGALFALLRLRYGTIWASVLGHGTSNTIGLFAFYLVGPIYGLW